MALNKSKTYKLFWDEDNHIWICGSEDFQCEGGCGECGLNDSGLAPLLAVADAAGYDVGIIADDLEAYHYSK